MLRESENVLSFPAFTPDVDYSALNELRPRPNEYFAVLDPPRTLTEGGIRLRALGDGWNDRHTESVQRAEDNYKQKEAEALERIAIYEKDKRSKNAYVLAQMASEIAMAAHATWVELSSPEPPGAALEQRSDAYTIARVGENVPFAPGDRVMIAPYAAHRFQELNGIQDVALVGREDPWEDITALLLNPLTQEWEPVDNWIVAKIDAKTVATANGLTIQQTRRKFLNSGKVMMAGPKSSCIPGERIGIHKDRTIHRPDNTKFFATKHGPWDGLGVLCFREQDSDGTRRVIATIERPSL